MPDQSGMDDSFINLMLFETFRRCSATVISDNTQHENKVIYNLLIFIFYTTVALHILNAEFIGLINELFMKRYMRKKAPTLELTPMLGLNRKDETVGCSL